MRKEGRSAAVLAFWAAFPSIAETPSCSQESVHVALVRIKVSSSGAHRSSPVSGIHEDVTLLDAQSSAVLGISLLPLQGCFF